MNSNFVEKQEIVEISKKVMRIIVKDLEKMGLIERYVPRKAYAKYYGLSVQTIHCLTEFLRKKGAVFGIGKVMRYDKFSNPNTGAFIIQKDVYSKNRR